jgi:DNA-binding NarL/FixJ family response regulator
MLDDDALMTRAALYDMCRGHHSVDHRGFSGVEIYQYTNARRAVLTFEIAGGLAELVRAGEVHVGADDEGRYRLTPAGAQAEEAYRLKPPTARQVQLLERREAGLSPEDIAQELGMRSRTVRVQITMLLRLFNVGSRQELLVAGKLAKSAQHPWPRRVHL